MSLLGRPSFSRGETVHVWISRGIDGDLELVGAETVDKARECGTCAGLGHVPVPGTSALDVVQKDCEACGGRRSPAVVAEDEWREAEYVHDEDVEDMPAKRWKVTGHLWWSGPDHNGEHDAGFEIEKIEVAERLRLSQQMLRVLENVEAGRRPDSHVFGAAKNGGYSGTMRALYFRYKLVADGAGGWQLTRAGRAALREHRERTR